LVAELGDRATAGTVDEAAAGADLEVVAIPIGAFDSVPVPPLAGKTAIVTSN
jgi:8-hydroxy-5-deazaflavin:NADPH oxidoreductase